VGGGQWSVVGGQCTCTSCFYAHQIPVISTKHNDQLLIVMRVEEPDYCREPAYLC